MDKIKFYKSILIDEKEVNEITPDFDNLPSNAIARSQTFLAQRRYQVMNPSNDVEMHCLMCGLAADMALEDAYRLHPKDKMKCAEASIIFFNSDSENAPESTTSE